MGYVQFLVAVRITRGRGSGDGWGGAVQRGERLSEVGL